MSAKTHRKKRVAKVERREVIIEKPVRRKQVQRASAITGVGLYKMPKALRYENPKTVGANVGAWLGHGIHNVVKALTGFGDYNVETNNMLQNTNPVDPPIVVNSRGGTIVRHREFISDVFASTSFLSTPYAIQPGSQTFPWLNNIANQYQEWRPRGIVFEFKSMSSEAVIATNTSGALGTVIMATQYNSLLPLFPDKHTMENTEYSNSEKPSCSFMHPIECKGSQSVNAELYVRSGNSIIGDQRLYDLGVFQIAVQGMASGSAGSIIGELWCTYEIELLKPIEQISGFSALTDYFSSIQGVSGITAAKPFGLGTSGTLEINGNNGIGCTLSTNQVIFPLSITDGFYLITYVMTGATPTTNSPGIIFSTTINVNVVTANLQKYFGDTLNLIFAPQAALTGVNNFMFQALIQVIQSAPGLQPSVAFALTGAMPTGGQTCDVIITNVRPM